MRSLLITFVTEGNLRSHREQFLAFIDETNFTFAEILNSDPINGAAKTAQIDWPTACMYGGDGLMQYVNFGESSNAIQDSNSGVYGCSGSHCQLCEHDYL